MSDLSHIKYPATVTFHVTRDTRIGEQKVSATVEKGTTRAANRKYSDIKQISLLKDVDMAIIAVRSVENEDEFKQTLQRYTERWEVRKDGESK